MKSKKKPAKSAAKKAKKAKRATKVKKVKARKAPAKSKRTKLAGKKSVKRPSSSAKAKAKAAKEAAAGKPKITAPPNSVLAGRVEDYYAKIGVVALILEASLSLGDHIQILGHTTNFEQTVDSMQVDHAAVTQADSKAGVGIKVTARARCGDHVYILP
jgi:hypothetical protein